MALRQRMWLGSLVVTALVLTGADAPTAEAVGNCVHWECVHYNNSYGRWFPDYGIVCMGTGLGCDDCYCPSHY